MGQPLTAERGTPFEQAALKLPSCETGDMEMEYIEVAVTSKLHLELHLIPCDWHSANAARYSGPWPTPRAICLAARYAPGLDGMMGLVSEGPLYLWHFAGKHSKRPTEQESST